jgi:hypothetical protein
MDCARKHGCYGHRDATMILVAYRHGLRASKVCDLHGHKNQEAFGEFSCTSAFLAFSLDASDNQ